jgi:hypothetical protein
MITGNWRAMTWIWTSPKCCWTGSFVLDSLTVEDEPDMAGKEILERHVRVKYPEAHLLSWDSFSVRSEGQWVIVSRTPTSEG